MYIHRAIFPGADKILSPFRSRDLFVGAGSWMCSCVCHEAVMGPTFFRPFLAILRRFFPVFSPFSPSYPQDFQKPAPRPRNTVRKGCETVEKRGSKTVSSAATLLAQPWGTWAPSCRCDKVSLRRQVSSEPDPLFSTCFVTRLPFSGYSRGGHADLGRRESR